MRSYLSDRSPPTADEVSDALWGSASDDSTLPVIVDQYKLYVEMADRTSARRATANTFFLTLNTAIFSLAGAVLGHDVDISMGFGAILLAVLVVQCLVWFWIVRSYRQLGSAKWAVVGALEQRLPASPWWRAEWTALGEGKDPSRYWPLTHLEEKVPLVFALAYLAAFATLGFGA